MKREAVATLAFAALLAALAFSSSPREVGDASEYVRMAERLAAGRLPGAGESRHFIAYPALAAPLVAALGALGSGPLRAFTILNGLLLAAAFRVCAARLHWAWCAMVFAGPILWWIDKPHTEPFTFALLAVAFSLAESAPWWSLAAIGAAATQNPGNAALLAVIAAAAAIGRPRAWRDRRLGLGLASGAALALIHPVYYLARTGAPSRLAGASDIRLVTAPEFFAALADPNLGLLPNAPMFTAAVVLASCALLVRAVRTRSPRALCSPGVCAAAVSAAWLAFVAATATNVNHGGTPGLSRYATWFIPLAIPLFQQADRAFPRAGRSMAAIALAAAALSAWAYRPSRPEAAASPTRLASFLWSRHPSLYDPLPEVFAERLRGLDENWLPVATPGCEKVLLPGRGGRDSVWPMPCAPVPVPARCQAPGALCYANRTRTGYAFAAARVSAPQAFRLDRGAAWPPSAEAAAAGILASLAWWEMRIAPPGSAGAIVAGARLAGRVFAWQAEDRLFVFALDTAPGASLSLEPAREMRGGFTAPDGAVAAPPVELRPGNGPQDLALPAPQPWVILVASARSGRDGG
ncbi:MAG TPA: hypothetical protein PLE61_01970 [Vicinamibacterales bacterium]|nr:hypothetical protein [Vicinamibacterales bacterium]HPW19553.1 hypothetical protein [Vicinamibacterales bacterium]